MKDLFIGLMSGTSIDAIDAALIDFSAGTKLLGTHSLAIENSLRQSIRDLNHPQTNELETILQLDRRLGYLFAETANELLKKNGLKASDIQAIGSHGQTIRHDPSGRHGYTLQIADPNTIAEETGITVVADFRRRDIAAGGQGAPLASGFHETLCKDKKSKQAVINIGGMANITIINSNTGTIGYDTGPGNVLMDYWISKHKNLPFDNNGQWATTGQVLPGLLAKMLQHAYFREAPPKSTGREAFDSEWLVSMLTEEEKHKPEDVQATLLELTARSIADCIRQEGNIEEIYICGGGACNQALLARLESLTPIKMKTTESLGIAPGWVECAAFASFARNTLQQRHSNVPGVTGARGQRILGAIYYGLPR